MGRAFIPLLGPPFPRPEAIGDNLHRGHRRLAQTSVAGNLSADPFALMAQHLTYAFQLTNDAVDFIHGGAREAQDQRIQVSGGTLISLTAVASLAAEERDTSATRPGLPVRAGQVGRTRPDLRQADSQ